MGNTIGRFGYVLLDGRKAPIRTNSIVQFCVERWSESEQKVPLISPHLMTDGEISQYGEALKKDIDEVVRNAREALARANGI